jgi:periplasmic nitrate reductase NapD
LRCKYCRRLGSIGADLNGRAQMNLSGIVVIVDRPENTDTVARAVAALPGIEVTQIDRASNRLVVVQEAATVDAEVDGFRLLQQTAGVVNVDLVFHYVGDQPEVEPDLSTALASLQTTIEPIARAH